MGRSHGPDNRAGPEHDLVREGLSPRVALVLGGAADVHDDIEAALRFGEYAGVVACNDIAAQWPGYLDAMVTLHPEKLEGWLNARSALGYVPPARVFLKTEWREKRGAPVTSRVEPLAADETDYRFPGQANSGSSGLFAVKVALVDLGFDKVVCCGVPMSPEGSHYVRQKRWPGALNMQRGWTEAMPEIKAQVRSMSGWTMEKLGAPTPEWISEPNLPADGRKPA
jgi:hypothetical protein